MKQPTKEQLLAENAKLKSELEFAKQEIAVGLSAFDKKDESLRIEFSNALDAPFEKDGDYGYSYNKTSKRRTYSWHEIFRELGRVLAAKNYLGLEEHTKDLQERVRRIEDRHFEEDNPQRK